MKAFDLGADGVAIFACPENQCHYINGSKKAEERIEYLKKSLDVLGIGGERLVIHNVNSCEPDRFVLLATNFAGKMRAMSIDTRQL
jgi:coenzyme F420-reducing hydrogenase delta subunit